MSIRVKEVMSLVKKRTITQQIITHNQEYMIVEFKVNQSELVIYELQLMMKTQNLQLRDENIFKQQRIHLIFQTTLL